MFASPIIVRPVALFLCGALGVVAMGCNSKRGPSILLRIADVSVGGTARCGDPAVVAGKTLDGSVSKVRVTMRARDAAGKTLDFCDGVFTFPGEPPFFRAPSVGGATIDIFAEAYGPAQPADPASANMVRRLESGSLLGVDPNAASLAALRLYRTEDFRCAPARLAQSRAFHSATLLPDGRVLFVGGLVSNTNDPSATALPMAGLTATGAAELYNPRDQTLTPVSEPAPNARAFHHAFLTTGATQCPAGNFSVLLVGGLAPQMAGKPMLGTSRGEQGGRLVPFDMNTIPNPLGAVAVGNEILCLDPAANTATRIAAVGSPAAAFQGADGLADRVVSAGGLIYDSASLNTIQTQSAIASFDLTSNSATTGMTTAPRAGASVTVLDATRALVWGGGASSDPVGDLVSNLQTTPSAAAVTSVGSVNTQFHTATLVSGTGAPTILVTGGFEITAGGVNTQPPTAAGAVRLVTISGGGATASNVGLSGGYIADPTCADPDRYLPAGWEASVGLSRGRVLVTGGSPSTMTVPASMRCGDCPDPSNVSLVCAIGQASLFNTVTTTLAKASGSLQVPRFGHTMTLLADGSVLVAGGVGAEPGPVFLGDLEVYNPRTLLAPYDSTSGLDDDDPIVDDVKAAMLQRAPGEQAKKPGGKDAARPCGTL